MIRLKNVSKFYYSKGVIASGFTKVNLQFEIGEFVAITGESGSGKSTLINVISGLESYEEGEMYIDGKETSHYLEKDWEIYRRKNIGNIYQNFNLINSYTVYQNIDLILSLNGVKKKERKKKIIDLLNRVDLLKYKNTKLSKLSGGQKQRVAIAHALAKDVPIIIADEPTGNLDKKSAENVMKLLKEISEDKLVIIVTHNYEQVKDYATRKITMHDGRVLEDRRIKSVDEILVREENKYKDMSFLNKVRVGFRNTFNVLPKFILLFLVYSFIIVALMSEYSAFKQAEYQSWRLGYNLAFRDLNDHRIVINKEDKSEFTEEEINQVKNLKNIDYIIKNDALVDREIEFTDDNELWLSGTINDIENFEGSVDIGRLPEKDNEIIIQGLKGDYYIEDEKDKLLNAKFYLEFNGDIDKNSTYTIVGIKYVDDTLVYFGDYKFFAPSSNLDKLMFKTHKMFSKLTVDFMGTNHVINEYDSNYRIVKDNWVTPGTAVISEAFNYECEKENCLNKKFNVKVKNLYYEESKDFVIKQTYNAKNINKKLELKGYKKEEFDEKYNGNIFINPIDYNKLFNKGTYQMSVYVKDYEELENTSKELNKMGYKTIKVKDYIINEGYLELIKAFKLVGTVALVIVLFFISYFIIKLILKSRNVYFAILRMLGASKKVCRHLLTIELLVVANLSYFVFIGLAELNKVKYLGMDFINTINTYFKMDDYIILYIIIICMSILLSIRYASKLFKDSVMNSYREEV